MSSNPYAFGTSVMPPASASRAGATPEASRDTSSGTFANKMSNTSYEIELQERGRRQKEWDAMVAGAIKDVEDSMLKLYKGFHHTTFFGAMGIDPSIWRFGAFSTKMKY